MRKLSKDYRENVTAFDEILRVGENFDMLKKVLKIGKDEITMYYIDGFVKDGVMQKLMIYFLSLDGVGEKSERAAYDFVTAHVPHVEAEVSENVDDMIRMVLSGTVLLLGAPFEDKAVIIDARSYPARETSEPENDRVMRGARDGFVETLVFNTALLRRRIRDTSLTMSYLSVGTRTKTDVVVCYLADKADPAYVAALTEKLKAVKTDAVTAGMQSIAECLIKTHWYNPFPKIRTTERPDSAAAQLLEGNVLVLCDNTPEVMVLPTGILDLMQDTNDFYFPPLTGTYLRLLRYVIFLLSLILMPLWLIAIKNPDAVPQGLRFVLPADMGEVPILGQIFLAEFVIDGLRLASMNTPGMLSNSLSVIGGLILGDFSIQIGWLIPEVILYGAFVAIANFSQRNYELGYAFKFMRLLLIVLTELFNWWGFVAGIILIGIFIGSNRTLNGKHSYLYPLIPFNGKVLARMLLRLRKRG